MPEPLVMLPVELGGHRLHVRPWRDERGSRESVEAPETPDDARSSTTFAKGILLLRHLGADGDLRPRYASPGGNG